jgi:CPA1 family monovalent cation:H+ antiporter
VHFSNFLLELSIIILSVSALTALLTKRLRVPYTVGLVIIGLIFGLLNRLQIIEPLAISNDIIEFVETEVTPGLILGIFVTPLLFEAAFHLSWENLKRELVLVLALAVPGVILTTFLVGAFLFAESGITGIRIPIRVALIFGAMMAATDPVSVIALFRNLGVPKRLQVLLEGESLFNDGTAIVVFALVLQIVLNPSDSELNTGLAAVLEYFVDFVRVAGGGLLVGMALGWLFSQFMQNIDDPLIETTLTTVLAFGTYLLAEQFHVSGVLAVVAAGLVSGNIGPRGMSPSSRILVANFWEYAAFISNSALFLLIGLEIDLTDLFSRWQLILLAILAVLLARAIVVYGFSWIGRSVPLRWKHILFWGGLRGAISLALALSLPLQMGVQLRTTIQSMAFGVVLFTILVQGISMESLVRRLGLTKKSETQEEYERRHARAVAARAAYDHIEKLHNEGMLSQHSWSITAPILKEHSEYLADSVREVMEYDPDVEAEELDTARREALRAERSALIGLLNDGVISEEVFSQLKKEIDDQLADDQTSWLTATTLESQSSKPYEKLMTVVVQIQDVENAISELNAHNIFVTRLSSTGGFLGRRNVILLIAVPFSMVEPTVSLLNEVCCKRVDYVATPLESSPLSLPMSVKTEIGGATIFTLDIERFEEL